MATVGKNKRRQLEVYDDVHNITLSVDSNEEVDFTHWCCEAVKLSVLNDFQYQPDSFRLFDAESYIDIEGKNRSLYREHKYSPDFLLLFDAYKYRDLSKEFKIRQEQLSSTECSVWIDTKGTFNNNARSFGTDRKWLWQKFKVFICEVIPVKFFEKFGVPEKSTLSPKKKQPRKCFLGFKPLVEIFCHSDKS